MHDTQECTYRASDLKCAKYTNQDAVSEVTADLLFRNKIIVFVDVLQ